MSTPRFPSRMVSPLARVSDAAWAALVRALEVQPIKAVSESGGFGAYDMRPRRLVELGFAQNLRSVRSRTGRQIFECEFAGGITKDRFLSDPVLQYDVLCRSLAQYHAALANGEIRKPEGMTAAGALAVLHRGGTGALRTWPGKAFDSTKALHDAACSAF